MENTRNGSAVDAWPIVDRVEELRHLSAALRAKRRVVILGAAGVGKTTLARMGLEQDVSRGMWVLHRNPCKPKTAILNRRTA
jgi:MoxR-like ATPase